MDEPRITKDDVKDIAELEVRRYFDTYLREVFPEQVKSLREHTRLMIERHDESDTAHGGVERRFNRLIWMLMGAASVGGAAGGTLIELISRIA